MKIILILILGFSVRMCAVDIVVTGTNGSAQALHFSTDNFRFQQVYGASAFPSLTPLGGTLTGIWFKVANNADTFCCGNFQINFSTTTRAVDGLSTDFAQNIGADDRVAFGPAAHNLAVGNGPLGEGSFLIPLTIPFYYNPAAGNLLMDVRVMTGYPVILPPRQTFSAFFDLGDQISSVNADGLSTPSGVASTLGLATAFGITPVIPEPGTFALILTGLCVTVLFGLRKNQPNNRKE